MRYRDFLNEKQLAHRAIVTELESCEKRLAEVKSAHTDLLVARWVLTEVMEQTQVQFKERVETLMTMVLNAVYPERDFKFLLDFQYKYNKLFTQPLVQDGDYDPEVPKDEMGGGMVSLISLVFRPILWSMQKPRSRPIFILDEPLKDGLSVEQKERAVQVIKEVSHELGFQMIIVTHDPALIEIADKSWRVEYDGKWTRVHEISS